MKIISKRKAMTIYRQHPKSRIFRYCTGKYLWHGSVCHYTGRDVPDITGVLAVYDERESIKILGQRELCCHRWSPSRHFETRIPADKFILQFVIQNGGRVCNK